MRVMCDLDGVVADFHSAVAELHGKKLPYEDGLVGDEAWCLPELWGMSDAEFYNPLGYDFWRNMPETDEAESIVGLLSYHFGRHNICFLTSPVLTEGCIEGKRDWGREHYPDIPMLVSITAKESKIPPKQFCADPDTLLIDDASANVDMFEKGRGIAYLLPRPWNRKHHVEDDPVTDLRNYIETLL
jgi:hypothetical protein